MLIVVTVNYCFDKCLTKTINSVVEQDCKDYEHIVIASGLSSSDTDKLIGQYSTPNRHFIVNKDTSIYNAMNLGLSQAKGDYILFLNGGDTFADSVSLSKIATKLNDGRCHLFRTYQIWQGDIYIRPSKKNFNKLLIHPAHQGFLAPLNEKTPRFDETRPINADVIWMRECINLFGVEAHEDVIANFYLGGVSNFPTIASVRKRYHGQGLQRAFFEVIKMGSRVVLGNRLYYKILAKKSGYSCADD